MSTGDIIKTLVKGIALGVDIYTTYHYAMGAGSPPPDLSSLAPSWAAICGGPLQDMLTSSYLGSEVVHTVVAGPNIGLQYIDATWSAAIGTLLPPDAPLTVCYVGQRRTGMATRSGRGRVFLSPIQRNVFDERGQYLVHPAGETAFLTSLITPLADGTPSAFLPCLYNQTTGASALLAIAERSLRAGSQRHRRERV